MSLGHPLKPMGNNFTHIIGKRFLGFPLVYQVQIRFPETWQPAGVFRIFWREVWEESCNWELDVCKNNTELCSFPLDFEASVGATALMLRFSLETYKQRQALMRWKQLTLHNLWCLILMIPMYQWKETHDRTEGNSSIYPPCIAR